MFYPQLVCFPQKHLIKNYGKLVSYKVVQKSVWVRKICTQIPKSKCDAICTTIPYVEQCLDKRSKTMEKSLFRRYFDFIENDQISTNKLIYFSNRFHHWVMKKIRKLKCSSVLIWLRYRVTIIACLVNKDVLHFVLVLVFWSINAYLRVANQSRIIILRTY